MFATLFSNPTVAAELGGDYWQQSRRPLASLYFVAPLLAIYEAGVVLLGPHAVRNGADVWLRQLLDLLGFSQYFLLPALTVGILLAWHYLTRQSWRVSPGVLYTMLAECAALALALVIIARIQDSVLSVFVSGISQTGIRAALTERFAEWSGEMVGYIGAGVYEELLFRLMLLPAAAWLFKQFGLSTTQAVWAAVLVTSFCFSIAHHIGPEGETFDERAFLFRFIAGCFFSLLFAYRGFGIAAGTHALYDILVSVIY